MAVLEGKVAIITGASAGIGKATAELFAAEGAKLVLGDILADEGRALAERLRADGHDAVFLEADVTRDADNRALVDRALSDFGRLDIAFNNAGIEGDATLTADVTDANYERVMAINVYGVLSGMRAQIPAMLDAGGGAIVNTSSIAGLVGFENRPVYVASKHAVVGLSKTAALEYALQGVRVNAVCPGVIRTEMIERAIEQVPGFEEQINELEPVGRMGLPEEVAAMVLTLCSDAGAFTTGQAIAVDGGLTAR